MNMQIIERDESNVWQLGGREIARLSQNPLDELAYTVCNCRGTGEACMNATEGAVAAHALLSGLRGSIDVPSDDATFEVILRWLERRASEVRP